MTQDALLVTTVLNSWKLIVGRASKAFDSFSDEDLQLQVSPGKNRVYYLLGHLAATHDKILPLLRLGERLHPELDDEFFDQPDGAYPGNEMKPKEVRAAWSEINEALTKALEALGVEQWLERHASISEADFANEPHRNRLSVLLGRTTHVAYHQGQLRLAR